MDDNVAGTLEPSDGFNRGSRTQCPPESFVALLMLIEHSHNVRIVRIDRIQRDGTVKSKRGIDRQPACRGFDNEAIEPFDRDQIEKSRNGNKINGPIESRLEIATDIDWLGPDAEIRGSLRQRHSRQQTEVVVHQTPILSRR